MNYEQQDIVKAFQLYTRLAAQGFIAEEDVEYYLMHEDVQSLLEQFVHYVDAILVQLAAPAGKSGNGFTRRNLLSRFIFSLKYYLW
ncbi:MULTISPECIES: DUF6063 family protein [Pelosinus]|jgi:predicted Rossmann-fold nucleotide-binding protein|uniref:Uncharacterized protein n=1 Tax=Pelosinus fermentans B4 TaxID=1149862 RepID=I8RKX1_9FIRM|nr:MULTISPECIES: DUF6063 family protein [Pelosinus]EIW20938.1 hypothetical protein FB4_1790 [Pelosinus fermentans B4]EIW27195.1 hypothetical protein FA11_1214 [Pelosinus fermentans A11]